MTDVRHDLLNAVNVLVGATHALAQCDPTPAQQPWLRIVRNTTDALMGIVKRLEPAGERAFVEGRARLADLCSIAADRVGKPFDQAQLVGAIERVAGRGPLRILLVDDAPELVALVRMYLDRTGWNIDVVENGEQAVARASTEHYDVLLMDIDLPGLDGATAAHAIRAAELARGMSPTPVIALTAFAEADNTADDREREDRDPRGKLAG